VHEYPRRRSSSSRFNRRFVAWVTERDLGGERENVLPPPYLKGISGGRVLREPRPRVHRGIRRPGPPAGVSRGERWRTRAGPERDYGEALGVSDVSEYFSAPDALYVYHVPNSHNILTAFNGFQGEQGRLREPFHFNMGGTLLVPIVLKPEESRRAHDYFQLAGSVRRKSDIALFPWLLTAANGAPYVKAGNINLNSDWFMRIPLGEAFDESARREDYATTAIEPAIIPLVERVWTKPYGHQSLAQMLNLEPADPVRLFKTPGVVVSALLSARSMERTPVAFRFVEDDETMPDDFNSWIDLDFDPGESG
jgi:hypothetical protein